MNLFELYSFRNGQVDIFIMSSVQAMGVYLPLQMSIYLLCRGDEEGLVFKNFILISRKSSTIVNPASDALLLDIPSRCPTVWNLD